MKYGARVKKILHNRWVKTLLVVLLLVCVYGAAGHWLLPWWLESFIPQQLQSLTGRQARVAEVRINPFTLEARIKGLQLLGPKGNQPAVDIGSLYVNLSAASIAHLAVVVDEVRIDQPRLAFARLQPDRYSFSDIIEHFAQTSPPAPHKEGEPLHFALYNIQLSHGAVEFEDAVAGRKHHIKQLNFALPFISNLQHDVDVFVTPKLSAKVNGSLLQIDGRSKPFTDTLVTQLALNLEALDIPSYMALVPVALPYTPVQGTLSSHLSLDFSVDAQGQPHVQLSGQLQLANLKVVPKGKSSSVSLGKLALQLDKSELLLPQVAVHTLTLHKLAVLLPGAKQPALAIADINLAQGHYDGPSKTLQVASLEIAAPTAALKRAANGQIDLLQALLPDAGKQTASAPANADAAAQSTGETESEAPAAKPAADSPPPADTSADSVAVKPISEPAPAPVVGADSVAAVEKQDTGISKQGGESIAGDFNIKLAALSLTDGKLSFHDAGTGSTPVQLQLSGIQATLKDFTTQPGAAMPVTLSAKQGSGSLAVDGTVVIAPLQLQLNTHASHFDLAPLQGYLAGMLNVNIERLQLGTQGKLQMSMAQGSALQLAYQGDVSVSDLAVKDKLTGQPFLNWKSLKVSELALDYPAEEAPFSVSTGAIKLADFYARIILNSNARLNVLDVIAGNNATGAPVSVTTPTKGKAAQPTPEPPADTGPAPIIKLGAIQLADGRVSYTDNYVKPHFSADLVALNGDIGSIASTSTQPTPVNLSGQLKSGGSVAIKGEAAPLAKPLALDLSAHAKGIELTRMSPYSAKYVGYNIKKGKLSVDVHYQLQAQKLKAENHVVLDQLTFGDQVDSPDALNLPVRLAVSLLKDSQGRIDLNLPISGSISDPKFSIGSVLMSAFTNLIGKALTSPFKLLASVLGAGAEKLSYVQFKPGLATLSDAAKAKLDQLAAVLAKRSNLQMDIAGSVDPASDPAGLQLVALRNQLKAAKLRDEDDEQTDLDQVSLSPDEYNTYLEALYDNASFEKPKNFLGFTKSQPPETMQAMLLEQIKLPDDALRELAQSRAQTAMDYLVEHAKVARERLFLAAPELNPDSSAESGSHSRVNFSLK